MTVFEHGYALVIGVAGYRTRELPPLPLAVLNDAVDFACTLWNPDICCYRADRVRLLLDEQATAKGIRDGLEWLIDSCTGEDTGVIFFSGHGWSDSGDSYLAAYDARMGLAREGMIAGEELTNYLSAIRAGRLAVFLDCCHSGGIAEIKGVRDTMPYGFRKGFDERTYERLCTGRGRLLLPSCGPEQEASVSGTERNSLFTDCLLRGLREEAKADDSGLLGVLDLFKFVSQEVQRCSVGRQTPLLKGQVMDNFPIAFRRAHHSTALPQLVPPSPPQTDQRTVRAGIYFEDATIDKFTANNSGER